MKPADPFTQTNTGASRSYELKLLERILTRSHYAVIHGPPGVGKSRLAHVFAQRMVHLGRVGRHVRVSIRSGDGVVAMLHGFCRELFGPGSSLLSVADSTELMDRISSKLAERPTLIQLEERHWEPPSNFPSPLFARALLEQWRHERDETMEVMARLLEVRGAHLLITSRERPVGPFAIPDCVMELAPFPADDGVDQGANDLVPESSGSIHFSRGQTHAMFDTPLREHPMRFLGMFYQGADFGLLATLSGWDQDMARVCLQELIEAGMAPFRTPGGLHIPDVDPGMFPSFRAGLTEEDYRIFLPLWLNGMNDLLKQINEGANDACTFSRAIMHLRRELPNLLVALHELQQRGNSQPLSSYEDLLVDLLTRGDLHVVKKAIFQSAFGKP